MRFLISAAVAVFAAAAFVGSAGATTLDLTGSIGRRIARGDDGSVTYRGNSDFGAVRFISSPNGSDLTWSEGNGLGIDCPRSARGCGVDSSNQIDPGEFLTVRFEHSVFLTSVDIALLSTTGRYFLRTDETGSIIGDGFDIDFDSDDSNRNGVLRVNVNRWVTSIRFVPDGGEQNDFSVARLRIDEDRPTPGHPPSPGNPIPEPNSVLLMLVGAGIVATQVRAR